MKAKWLLLLLLVATPLGIFVAARQVASWHPQIITKAEFAARFNQEIERPDFGDEKSLSAEQERLKRLAQSKGWNLEAISGDGQQVLASGKYRGKGAILSAKDGRVLTQFATPISQYKSDGWWRDPRFSADDRLFAFSEFEVCATQVHDSRTGKRLWSGQGLDEKFRFSPDGRLAALALSSGARFVSVREARSGREVKRLPIRQSTERWNFSRDGQFLLAEVSPGQFRQLRLR